MDRILSSAIGPSDVANLLLAALARRRATSVIIEPSGTAHRVSHGRAGKSTAVALLDAALADAVVARLAILADLSPGVSGTQVGRVTVRLVGTASGPVCEVLVVIRETPRGLVAELCRVLGGDDEAPRRGRDREASGERIVGNYRILGELGRGAMATVYRAEHLVLEKPVALKVLYPGLADQPALAAQFIVEGRAACRARHPGIVDVTDFGRFPDGGAYLVMELVLGPTLAALLASGPLPPARALGVAFQIASALSAAAAHGVVHRDLKPANVFVGEDDQVKIGDFGVACIIDPRTLEPRDGLHTAPVGTLFYMSPEQIQGGPVDGRSDLYSLGCILHEMLTGAPPFGGTAAGIMSQHLSAPPPGVVGPEGPLPEPLVRIVHRALAKRREDRYQTAAEMAGDLAAAQQTAVRVGWRRWLP